MYSIVMVAAMTAAPATPDWGFKHGGCYGCYGGGCYGGGWSSCHGCYGGGGCWGGGGWGSGCWGGGGWCGHGGVSVHSGCYGSGWGCHGSLHPVAPYAGLAFSGCHGQGAYYTGCMGYGSYYMSGSPTYMVPTGGFAAPIPGGATATPGIGSGTGTPGSGAGTGSPGTGGSGGKSGGGAGTPGGPGGISVPGTPVLIGGLPANRAQVIVLAPAGAKLFAEGEATSLTGTERVFLTPELATGRDYTYTLKLENGTEATTRPIVVRAGHRTVVDFTARAETVSTPVTVNLPAKAKLFVDGVPTAVEGGTRTFRTPELAKGKAFTYEFRAEVDKDGTTEVVSKKVTFTAGEAVTVDFVAPAADRTALK